MSNGFTLRFHGGPLDGLQWRWPDDALPPAWILFGDGSFHHPISEHVYCQVTSTINEDFVRGVLRYRYAGNSPGARIQRITLENNQRLRELLEETTAKAEKRIQRLEGRVKRYRTK